MKLCSDFKNMPGCPVCCASCHDDEDAGYFGNCLLDEVIVIDDTEEPAQLCCAMANFLREQGLIR